MNRPAGPQLKKISKSRYSRNTPVSIQVEIGELSSIASKDLSASVSQQSEEDTIGDIEGKRHKSHADEYRESSLGITQVHMHQRLNHKDTHHNQCRGGGNTGDHQKQRGEEQRQQKEHPCGNGQ